MCSQVSSSDEEDILHRNYPPSHTLKVHTDTHGYTVTIQTLTLLSWLLSIFCNSVLFSYIQAEPGRTDQEGRTHSHCRNFIFTFFFFQKPQSLDVYGNLKKRVDPAKSSMERPQTGGLSSFHTLGSARSFTLVWLGGVRGQSEPQISTPAVGGDSVSFLTTPQQSRDVLLSITAA